MANSTKPHFQLPSIFDYEGGWGPASDLVPDQFKDIPYAPYSKGDKLGRVADWTNPEGQKQDNRETTRQGRTGFNRFNKEQPQAYGASFASAFAYFHNEDESSFAVVDNRSTATKKQAMKAVAPRNVRTQPTKQTRTTGQRTGNAATASKYGQQKKRYGFKDYDKPQRVQSLLSKWFRTKHLSIAIGLQLSISRLSTFLGTLVANPVASATGDWVWAFWLSFILCGFSIIMNLIYALVVRHLRGQVTLTKEEREALKQKKTFKWRSIFKFPTIFWHIILIEFIYAAVWSSFQTISTDLVIMHFGSDKVLAGYKASASQVVPIVATPILGFIMDYYGCRVLILLLSAVFLILSSGLLGWSYVDATVGMVFYSISLAFGPIAMITSIGMVLPSEYIGTGLGIYKSANNVGTSILDVVVGVVQDKTANQSYVNVMLVFIILAAIGFVLIIALWANQFKFYGNLLEVRRTIRTMRMQEINDKELEYTSKGMDPYTDTPTRWTSYPIVGFFVAALLVAWVLFFVYSIHESNA
ncbi:Putative Eukaryotic translation initiation factor 3 subunit D [Rhizopus microsporus]|nr:Putative Eukaryotic translation initiation factor 3 subunit D [Rhizopus microsporus]